MTPDLRSELTAAYADTTLDDRLDDVVRRGRRIRRARRARRAAPALVAVAAVVVGITATRGGTDAGTPGPVDLVGYSVPAFPLSFATVPAGLRGPSISLDPSFDEVGPGTAHAGWSDPRDPGTGVGISVQKNEPENVGDDVGTATVRGVRATVHRTEVTAAKASFSVVWKRHDDQWVTVGGAGRFASRNEVTALARQVVDRVIAVPLQVGVAPRGWVVVAYKDDRILTLADPAGPPATEATARTLDVSLTQPPSAPADLPREVGSTGGRMYDVTVQGNPAYLVPTPGGWYLQASMADGTVFVLQTPADFSRAQVVEVADGVSSP